MNFPPKNIEYLSQGNLRQKLAYVAINDLAILNTLGNFKPTLAGTIPLDVDINSSDLDIICESLDLKEFESVVKSHYANLKSFKFYTQNARGIPSFIASFEVNDFTFEIFCQPIPVEKQYAVIHLNIEARLLKFSGAVAKESIRQLKAQGIKTELAFAIYFQIPGDPYDELAKLADYTDEQLQKIIGKMDGINHPADRKNSLI